MNTFPNRGDRGEDGSESKPPLRSPSLFRRVLDAVLDLGESTASTVLARVGMYIPSNQAIAYGKRALADERKRGRAGRVEVRKRVCSLAQLAELGRKVLVRSYLRGLCATGKIVRVRRGVYAPLPPKIYVPATRKRA